MNEEDVIDLSSDAISSQQTTKSSTSIHNENEESSVFQKDDDFNDDVILLSSDDENETNLDNTSHHQQQKQQQQQQNQSQRRGLSSSRSNSVLNEMIIIDDDDDADERLPSDIHPTTASSSDNSNSDNINIDLTNVALTAVAIENRNETATAFEDNNSTFMDMNSSTSTESNTGSENSSNKREDTRNEMLNDQSISDKNSNFGSVSCFNSPINRSDYYNTTTLQVNESNHLVNDDDEDDGIDVANYRNDQQIAIDSDIENDKDNNMSIISSDMSLSLDNDLDDDNGGKEDNNRSHENADNFDDDDDDNVQKIRRIDAFDAVKTVKTPQREVITRISSTQQAITPSSSSSSSSSSYCSTMSKTSSSSSIASSSHSIKKATITSCGGKTIAIGSKVISTIAPVAGKQLPQNDKIYLANIGKSIQPSTSSLSLSSSSSSSSPLSIQRPILNENTNANEILTIDENSNSTVTSSSTIARSSNSAASSTIFKTILKLNDYKLKIEPKVFVKRLSHEDIIEYKRKLKDKKTSNLSLTNLFEKNSINQNQNLPSSINYIDNIISNKRHEIDDSDEDNLEIGRNKKLASNKYNENRDAINLFFKSQDLKVTQDDNYIDQKSRKGKSCLNRSFNLDKYNFDDSDNGIISDDNDDKDNDDDDNENKNLVQSNDERPLSFIEQKINNGAKFKSNQPKSIGKNIVLKLSRAQVGNTYISSIVAGNDNSKESQQQEKQKQQQQQQQQQIEQLSKKTSQSNIIITSLKPVNEPQLKSTFNEEANKLLNKFKPPLKNSNLTQRMDNVKSKITSHVVDMDKRPKKPITMMSSATTATSSNISQSSLSSKSTIKSTSISNSTTTTQSIITTRPTTTTTISTSSASNFGITKNTKSTTNVVVSEPKTTFKIPRITRDQQPTSIITATSNSNAKSSSVINNKSSLNQGLNANRKRDDRSSEAIIRTGSLKAKTTTTTTSETQIATSSSSLTSMTSTTTSSASRTSSNESRKPIKKTSKSTKPIKKVPNKKLPVPTPTNRRTQQIATRTTKLNEQQQTNFETVLARNILSMEFRVENMFVRYRSMDQIHIDEKTFNLIRANAFSHRNHENGLSILSLSDNNLMHLLKLQRRVEYVRIRRQFEIQFDKEKEENKTNQIINNPLLDDEENTTLNRLDRLNFRPLVAFYKHFQEMLTSPYRGIDVYFDEDSKMYHIRVTFENDGFIVSNDASPVACCNYILHRPKNDMSWVNSVLHQVNHNSAETNGNINQSESDSTESEDGEASSTDYDDDDDDYENEDCNQLNNTLQRDILSQNDFQELREQRELIDDEDFWDELHTRKIIKRANLKPNLIDLIENKTKYNYGTRQLIDTPICLSHEEKLRAKPRFQKTINPKEQFRGSQARVELLKPLGLTSQQDFFTRLEHYKSTHNINIDYTDVDVYDSNNRIRDYEN